MPLFLIILLLSLSAPVLAETSEEPSPDRWYDIEVLIFTQQASRDTGTDHREVWPLDPGSPDLKRVIELAPAQADGVKGLMLPFALLPEKDWKLGEEDRKIRAGHDYTLISHLAWRQPAPPSEVAPPVHVRVLPPQPQGPGDGADRETSAEAATGQAPEEETPSIVEPPSFETSAAATAEADTGAATEPAPAEETPAAELQPEPVLDGIIRISRNNYLHVDADLLYRPEPPPAGELAAALETDTPIDMPPSLTAFDGGGMNSAEDSEEQVIPTDYRMRQSRRVKKGELNFFDHPRFGLLIRIDPVEQATGDTPAAE